MAQLHVSIGAEPLFPLFGTEITNSIFTGWVVNVLILLLLLTLVTNLRQLPTIAQALFESVFTFIHDLSHVILGDSLTKTLFPLFLSLFLYILFGSLIGLLPSVGTLGLITEEHGLEREVVPVFRAVTADLNATLALTAVVFVVINVFGIREHGLGYFKRYFKFNSPINAFVSILELISETIVRILSFSFRLFGNVFAGEVIITVMLSLAGYFVLPFLLFEVFVAFIQAFVFVILTMVFVSNAVAHEH